MEGQVYVRPHGEAVYVFGLVEYVRRVSGEEDDAQAHRCVEVPGFADFDAFRQWCWAYRRERARRQTPKPITPTPLRSEEVSSFPNVSASIAHRNPVASSHIVSAASLNDDGVHRSNGSSSPTERRSAKL
ncbi:hypothetical protein IQ251_09045 [Saccharopolyspora sp. HNM0983]|uniref:Uncharacterized protein n=1 Tax=Saccharopolyspora montiporae TaxID=2781240 RepID=A0A929BBP5_9PSEU|nr:hypothetical protein [Saccharopolyspora sp. HNM0983]MBE9374592.1 hypothetical protein [Saccharopolyspora sp. HNM0983]